MINGPLNVFPDDSKSCDGNCLTVIVASATTYSVLKDHFSGSAASGHFTFGSSLSVKGDLLIDQMGLQIHFSVLP